MTATKPEGLPEGMVAYGPEHPDYPSEPKDWDAEELVMLSGGFTFRQSDQPDDPIYWAHDHDDIDSDVIAYTPTKAATAEGQRELKACPFCGGDADLISRTSSTVQCQNDQCIIGDPAPFNDFSHREDAVRAWNTRFGDAELVELLKRAEMFAGEAATFDWNEDRARMVAIHLAGDIRATLAKHGAA